LALCPERVKPDQEGMKRLREGDKMVALHTHKFVARVTLRIPQSDNVGHKALQMVAEGVSKLQSRDESACLVCPADGSLAYKSQDLPSKWIDF